MRAKTKQIFEMEGQKEMITLSFSLISNGINDVSQLEENFDSFSFSGDVLNAKTIYDKGRKEERVFSIRNGEENNYNEWPYILKKETKTRKGRTRTYTLIVLETKQHCHIQKQKKAVQAVIGHFRLTPIMKILTKKMILMWKLHINAKINYFLIEQLKVTMG